MIDDENEVLLVLRTKAGDVAAFEKLLRRIHAPLRRYVAGMVGESLAEDVLQETALRIYRQIKSLDEPKVFRVWAYRIASRIAFAHLKREKRWRSFERDTELLEAIPSPSLPEEDFDASFLAMMDQISPASRAVLLFHFQQHLSLEETAAILDIPVGTAKSRLAYGVATLRKLMKERSPDE